MEQEEFTIDDASKADWAIEQIITQQMRRDYFVECAKEKIERLKEQIKQEEEKCETGVSYLSHKLADYMGREEVPTKTTKTQSSLTLPAGKVVVKFPKLDFVNKSHQSASKSKGDKAFVEEIKKIDKKYIVTTENVDWSALKKDLAINDENHSVFLKDTGEVVEYLIAEETPQTITVKAN